MTTEKKGCLAFAVCGSFCTLEDALGAAQALTAQGWTLLPVMSFAAQQTTDTVKRPSFPSDKNTNISKRRKR